MASGAVTDKDFENEVLQSNEPVVVDFWAEWCGPCKALSPVIDEFADEMKGKVKVVEETEVERDRDGAVATFVVQTENKMKMNQKYQVSNRNHLILKHKL